ncbi:hypothetical protein [Streptomyces sp. RTGN2]|uniref:hypothetical protein n=1 Tax=unclassified Streptomyces TaxID=2593676 RepID=UPI002553F3AD|nr:hypothetical protein [Streptomyces sp. RTGN2]
MNDRFTWSASCEDSACADPIHPTIEELILKAVAPSVLGIVEDIIEREYTKYLNERANGHA